MRQLRLTWLAAIATVAVGFLVGLMTQLVVFPLVGMELSRLAIGAIFMLVSLARSYVLQQMFEAIRG